MSYLERLDARAAIRAGAELPKGSKGAFSPFSSDPSALILELPEDVRRGLATLRSKRTPRLANPDRWPAAVSDALRLANDGWAAKAIALGWTDLELFGAVPDPDGDPAGDGLAVWLAGRELLAITSEYAVVGEHGGRAYFNRRNCDGAVLLWSLGSSKVGRS